MKKMPLFIGFRKYSVKLFHATLSLCVWKLTLEYKIVIVECNY